MATGIALKTQERHLAPRGLYSSASQFTQATEQKSIKIKVKNMCSLKVLPRFIATFVFINISVKKKEELNSIDYAISKRECELAREKEKISYTGIEMMGILRTHTLCISSFFLSQTFIEHLLCSAKKVTVL